MKLIIVLLIIFLLANLSLKIPRKTYNLLFTNLFTTLFYILEKIVVIIVLAISTHKTFQIIQTIEDNSIQQETTIALAIATIFLIVVIQIASNGVIIDCINTINYCINLKKTKKYGKIEKGRIIKIKGKVLVSVVAPHYGKDVRYQLIVDFKGKRIKSLYFTKNIYSKRKYIEVLVYKKHNYVLLKDETE